MMILIMILNQKIALIITVLIIILRMCAYPSIQSGLKSGLKGAKYYVIIHEELYQAT